MEALDTYCWRDRAERFAVEVNATLRRPDGTILKTIISNFSENGCALSGAFQVGETLEIRLPSSAMVRAEVRWSLAGRTGVRFLYAGER